MDNRRRYRNLNRVRALMVVSLGVVILAIAGCDKLKKEKKASDTDEGSEQTSKGQDGAEKKPLTPCEQYAKTICELTSETSPMCQSMKSLTAIIPEAACKAGMTDIDYTKNKVKEMRKSCDDLASKLCADIGPETETCTMVKTQVVKLPPERCQDMLKQYPRVVADLKKREEANKPLTPEKQQAIVEGATNVFGPADAKVTIVDFSDFQCPYSFRAAQVTKKLIKKYGDKVRFIYHHFPLSFHPQARPAAEASLAAGAQGKFWEYHDLVFENQRALERADLEKYAAQLKLNMKAFKKALDDKSFEKAVDADIKLGEKVAISGTPTMFLNGKRISNPTDYDMVSKEIEKALQ
ncbi:MAG: thioredoxin domain-containing protein [Deltaproteobacteria bacterium]|nr:thioredoxin domain-containing protein [Deltaproteobacteria bacterium]